MGLGIRVRRADLCRDGQDGEEQDLASQQGFGAADQMAAEQCVG